MLKSLPLVYQLLISFVHTFHMVNFYFISTCSTNIYLILEINLLRIKRRIISTYIYKPPYCFTYIYIYIYICIYYKEIVLM